MKRIFESEKVQDLWIKYRETIVYLIVGFVVSCVNWTIYTLLSSVLFIDVNLSNILAWIVAVLVAYFLNKKYVFCSFSWDKKIICKEFFSFVSGRVLTGVIEIGMVPVLLFFGIDEMLFGIVAGWAKAWACFVGIILNYFVSKYLVFKNSTHSQ